MSDMDNQLRRSQRDIKLTEKGAEFTLETKFKNRERCFKILSTLSDNLHKMLLTKRIKTLLNQHIVSGLISMKNSNYRMMKLKHGCHKVIKFLMNKV